MSVAFRRESDEEHKEPVFELPLPAGANLVTSRGARLIGEQVDAIEAAIAGEPDEERRKVLARDLRYWQTRRATALVAPVPSEGEAGIGSRVTLRLAGRERRVEIVGHDEADPAAGLIAYAAPLAHALLGAIAGERVGFNGVDDAIEVIAVEPPR